MRHYLLIVHGDVEPELKGPFKTPIARDIVAKSHREQDPEKNDGLYRLDSEGTVKVSPYGAQELPQ